MNLQNRWMIKAVGLLSATAAAVLVGLPGLANPSGTGAGSSSDGADNYANPSATPGNPTSPTDSAGVSNSDGATSTSDMQTPGNEDSPADSAGNSPTSPSYGNPGITGTEQQSSTSRESDISGSTMRDNPSSQAGPSAAGENFPGPSEMPSGSPSVPGTSTYDDPGMGSNVNRPSSERDALRPSPSSDMLNRAGGGSDQMNQGPSAVPSQTVPGPSETPSGSPSVPGTSTFDNPNDGSRSNSR
ncbi:MAG: hypothetical protein ACKO7W_20160 [Elainella sp.]